MTVPGEYVSPYAHAHLLGRKAARERRSPQSNPFKSSGQGYPSAWLAGYRAEKKAMREEADRA